MPHSQSYGQDKFAFCWVRILARFELQTLISRNPGPGWSWNSLGCNFNSGWTENIEGLGWFKSFEASKTQLEQQSRFTDLTRESIHFQLICLARQGGDFYQSRSVYQTSRRDEAPHRVSAQLRQYEVQSASIYFHKVSSLGEFSRPKNTSKIHGLGKSSRGAAQNSANTDPRTSKMTPRLNHIMIFEKQSRFAKWYLTAKVTVLISSHFLVVRIFCNFEFQS